MDKERFLQSGLLEQYVLGLTTDEEGEEVERYAHAFPDIQAEIDMLRNAVRQYAEREIASPNFKRRKADLNHTPVNTQDPVVRHTAAKWAAIAGFLLLGLLGIYYHQRATNTQQQVYQLNNDFQTFKKTCLRDHQDLQQELSFFQHQQTLPLQLTGTTLAPGSRIRVYWNEEQKMALLQVLFLPHQPDSNQYQIWADLEGKMVDLGLIDGENHQPQAIRCLPEARSLNITLEPQGGSEAPHVNQLYANVNLP